MREKGKLEQRNHNKICIVGEGITEQYYFQHLKKILNLRCIVKPNLFGKTSIEEIDKTVKQRLSADMFVICVFDLDVSERDNAEKKKLDTFLNLYKNNNNVLICTSLPSIEYWFLIHYKFTTKYFSTSKEVEKELKTYLKNYVKTRKFLENEKWVEELLKDDKLQITIEQAKRNTDKSGSHTNIHEAIEKLRG